MRIEFNKMENKGIELKNKSTKQNSFNLAYWSYPQNTTFLNLEGVSKKVPISKAMVDRIYMLSKKLKKTNPQNNPKTCFSPLYPPIFNA